MNSDIFNIRYTSNQKKIKYVVIPQILIHQYCLKQYALMTTSINMLNTKTMWVFKHLEQAKTQLYCF